MDASLTTMHTDHPQQWSSYCIYYVSNKDWQGYIFMEAFSFALMLTLCFTFGFFSHEYIQTSSLQQSVYHQSSLVFF